MLATEWTSRIAIVWQYNAISQKELWDRGQFWIWSVINVSHRLPLVPVLTECVANAHNLYGRCARCWISIVPGFVLSDPHDVQTVLSSHRHTDKMFVYRFLHSFLGAGLLTNNGRKWSEHRRLIQPAFHQRILAEFVTVFDEATATCMRNLHAKSGVDIDITREANEFVLQVLNGNVRLNVFQ